MFAVIELSGKQYLVQQGQILLTDRLAAEAGSTMNARVLLLSDGTTATVGTPTVDTATVTLKVVEHLKGKKIDVLKYKPKVRYRKKTGHRQFLTEVEVTKIA